MWQLLSRYNFLEAITIRKQENLHSHTGRLLAIEDSNSAAYATNLDLAHFSTDREMLDLSNRYKMEPLFERELCVVDIGIQ
jgi:hypothetical protein